MLRPSVVPVAALALVTVLVPFANDASAETVNKCNAAKRKCVAKLSSALLGCHAKAVKKGEAVDAECLAKAHAKFDGAATPEDGCFEKLETKHGASCLTQDDTATAKASVDGFVADVVAALEPSYPAVVESPCSAGKLKCVAQNTAALLGCQAKAALTGTLDPKCVLKAQQKLDGTLLDPPDASKGCFEKLEAKADACLTFDDTPPLAQQVAAAVDLTQCTLDPADPNCACPTRMAFMPDATDPRSVAHFGWMGFGHRQRLVSNGAVGFAVSNCANASVPCGPCTLTGPVDPPNVEHRRCTLNSRVHCTSDAECSSGGWGTCVFFLSPPWPVSGSGVPNCVTMHASGSASGTLNPETGETTTTLGVATRFHITGSADVPCPRCVSNVCQGGPYHMQFCTPEGASLTPHFGDTSLDCPPPNNAFIGTTTRTIAATTGMQTMTLTADQPFCRASGATSKKCFCDTCNSGTLSNVLTSCSTNADCPDPAGPIGPICGGPRCANTGAACTVGADCPGSFCSVPGQPTAPNSCNDGVCSSDGQGHALCAAGPLDPVCAPSGTYVSCSVDADCAAFPGDTCSGLRPRACFLDNGVIGGQISAVGTSSPTDPTFAWLSCVAATQNPSSNVVFGYPGPSRITHHGAMVVWNEPRHRVFATSTVHSGALGGLAGADAICQARADAAALGGTYRAWLSGTGSPSAKSRLTHALGDYVLVDGTLVGRGWSDLADGTLLAAIAEDETGAPVTGSAWTNSTVDGNTDAAACAGWTSSMPGDSGQTGNTSATNAAWTDDVPFESCVEERRLYCLEQ